jgi:hypothetical protein
MCSAKLIALAKALQWPEIHAQGVGPGRDPVTFSLTHEIPPIVSGVWRAVETSLNATDTACRPCCVVAISVQEYMQLGTPKLPAWARQTGGKLRNRGTRSRNAFIQNRDRDFLNLVRCDYSSTGSKLVIVAYLDFMTLNFKRGRGPSNFAILSRNQPC